MNESRILTMVIQCCKCKRVRRGAEWAEVEDGEQLDSMIVSHGYCPECAEAAFEELRAFASQSPGLRDLGFARAANG